MTTRTYVVIDVPEGTPGSIFTVPASAGPVVSRILGGRRRRVFLTDTPLYKGRFVAEAREYL